jgi:hypothetical protein
VLLRGVTRTCTATQQTSTTAKSEHSKACVSSRRHVRRFSRTHSTVLVQLERVMPTARTSRVVRLSPRHTQSWTETVRSHASCAVQWLTCLAASSLLAGTGSVDTHDSVRLRCVALSRHQALARTPNSSATECGGVGLAPLRPAPPLRVIMSVR